MGYYVEAFLDLQRLRKVAPGWPGLLQLLEETATLSLGNRKNYHVPAVCISSWLLRASPQGAKIKGLFSVWWALPGRDWNTILAIWCLQGSQNVAGSFYAVLQIPVQASPQDIRRAYRMQASKWHPDKWGGGTKEEVLRAKEKYMDVVKAFETLGDEQKRCMYNARNSLC